MTTIAQEYIEKEFKKEFYALLRKYHAEFEAVTDDWDDPHVTISIDGEWKDGEMTRTWAEFELPTKTKGEE